MWVYFIIAFNMGLFSTLHCVGMCGSIITTLMLASSDSHQGDKKKSLTISFAYNIGRILSYSFAGLIIGLFGSGLAEFLASFNANFVLQIIASLVLIGLALNILGVVSFSKHVEGLGMRLWKQIQPVTKSLLPVDSFGKALLFGMVWGWLPCGLVYSALLFSLGSGSAINGMLVMLFFGLGTLPGMLSAGYFSDHLNRYRNHTQLRWMTAIILIFIALGLPISSYYFSDHHSHSEHVSHMHH